MGGYARYVCDFSAFRKLTSNRAGYDFLFGERTNYTKVFYDKIKNKSKILLNKNIISVEESDDGVTVKCDDGTFYQGDILAGADGVRSKVRQEMWRLGQLRFPELVEHDKHGTFAIFKIPRGMI